MAVFNAITDKPMQSRLELRKLIADAFSGAGPPAADKIAYPNDWDYDCIARDLGAYLDDPPPDKVIENHAKSLSALLPHAFVFFLPFYMAYSIDHPESEVTDVLVSNLHSATTSTADYWKSRLEPLTRRHREAICAFLKFQVSQEISSLGSGELDRTVQFWCASKT